MNAIPLVAGIDPCAIYLSAEAAALIRVKVCTIQTMIRTGRLKARGRPYRILGAELLKEVTGARYD